MTTVKEFKDLGVPFVVGDECSDNTDSIAYTNGWYVCGNAGDELFDQCKVTRFAWRPISTLPANPKFKCEVSTDYRSWRPLLDQSEVIKSRDEPMPKPVFTQAMADAGELPPVGSDVAYARNYCYLDTGITSNLVDGEPLSVISHKSVEGVTVAVVWSYKSEVATSLRSECYKPIYIRTPKQKAVDDLKTDILNFYGYNDGDGYKSLSEYLNERGYRKAD